jgi:hypothetical protein
MEIKIPEKDTGDILRFRENLRAMDESLFDGHTEFSTLTPEQKLLWLSQTARFFHEIKNVK